MKKVTISLVLIFTLFVTAKFAPTASAAENTVAVESILSPNYDRGPGPLSDRGPGPL